MAATIGPLPRRVRYLPAGSSMLSALVPIVVVGTVVLLLALSASAWPAVGGRRAGQRPLVGPQRPASEAPRWLGLVVAPLFALAVLPPVWATGAAFSGSGFAMLVLVATGLLVAHGLYVRTAIRRARAGTL